MEHLLLPSGAELEPEELVPYISDAPGGGDPYDGGAFAEYPLRAGQTDFLNHIRTNPEGHMKYRVEPWAQHDFDIFVQRWLFFGLLHETFGPAYHARDFVRLLPVVDRPQSAPLQSCLNDCQVT